MEVVIKVVVNHLTFLLFSLSVVSADPGDEGPPGGPTLLITGQKPPLRLPGPMVYIPGNLLVGLILI